MCSYMCASPAYSGDCVKEPLRTVISTVASGTPWFSTTMTSSPFGRTLRWMILSSSALCAPALTEASSSALAIRLVRPLISRIMSNAFSDLLRKGSLATERLREHVPLAPFTTFKIGGPADVLYDATSADDLANAVTAARASNIPFYVLGLGANILVGDRGFRGLVIRNSAAKIGFPGPTQIHAESGAVMFDLIKLAVARGLSGLEHYVGIPSTVGGAVWQNLHFLAPAPGRERTMFIEEVTASVELLTPSGARLTIPGSEMQFGYDTSRLHHSGEIALAVTFDLARVVRRLVSY